MWFVFILRQFKNGHLKVLYMVKVMTPTSSLSQICEQVKNTVLVNVAIPCTKTEILRYWKGSVIEHKQWKTFIIHLHTYNVSRL